MRMSRQIATLQEVRTNYIIQPVRTRDHYWAYRPFWRFVRISQVSSAAIREHNHPKSLLIGILQESLLEPLTLGIAGRDNRPHSIFTIVQQELVDIILDKLQRQVS